MRETRVLLEFVPLILEKFLRRSEGGIERAGYSSQVSFIN